MFVGFHKAMTPSGLNIVKDVNGCGDIRAHLLGAFSEGKVILSLCGDEGWHGLQAVSSAPSPG